MKHITVLASGSAGCRIMAVLQSLPGAENLHLHAFDSDAEALKTSLIPEDRQILAGAKWRDGRGCGGNVNNGQSAAAAERAVLEEKLAETELLIVVAGLGGGFGSGSMPIILSVANKLRIPSVFFAVMPFSFEGPARRRQAEKTVTDDMLPLGAVVVEIPNDLLFCTLEPTVPYSKAFECSDHETASGILALAILLTSGNRLSADFSTLSALLRKRQAVCSIGFADAGPEDPDKEHLLLDGLLNSPLLGGSSRLKEADAVMLMLNGGRALSLGDASAILEHAERYIPKNAELLVGAGEMPEWQGRMSLTALTVKYSGAAEPESGASETERKNSRKRVRKSEDSDDYQPSLFDDRQEFSLGIMEHTTPSVIDGVNYDAPAFQRGKLTIDKGRRTSGN